MSDTVRQFTVEADDAGIRLDRWFKRHLPQIGFATVSRWARTGQIRVDGKRAKPDDRLETGQVLRVPPGGDSTSLGGNTRRELSEAEIEQAEAMVITQDRAAIVLNKPPGLATQGGTKTPHHVDGLLDAFTMAGGKNNGPRPRLVHRLDKDTSGVLLIARTPGSAAFFSRRFAGRSAKKVYWALVVGVPDIAEGTIEAPIAKQPGTGGEKMYVDESQGQAAKTRYRVVDRAGNRAAWVELQPLTGRTHQLRVHMAAIGHPIVGDGKYGGQDAFLTGSISRKLHLHARRLIIDHPDGTPLDVTAELPTHFAASMEQMGFDQGQSDATPDQALPPPSREQKKQAARAHSKQYRKERRGERRSRNPENPEKPGKPGGKPGKAAIPGKPDGRTRRSAAPGKSGGKPGKPASAAGKPDGKPGKWGGKPGKSAGPGKPAGKPARSGKPASAKKIR